jgi:hypothetical protein
VRSPRPLAARSPWKAHTPSSPLPLGSRTRLLVEGRRDRSGYCWCGGARRRTTNCSGTREGAEQVSRAVAYRRGW